MKTPTLPTAEETIKKSELVREMYSPAPITKDTLTVELCNLIDEHTQAHTKELDDGFRQCSAENSYLSAQVDELKEKLKEALDFLRDDHFENDEVVAQFCIYTQRLLK